MLPKLIYDEGDENNPEPELEKVNTLDFLRYIDGSVKIPEVVIEAAKPMLAEELEKLKFPQLSKEDFQQLLKEPLWSLTKAILYVNGISTSQNKTDIISYIKVRPEMIRLCGYINSAKKTKDLDYFLARSEFDEAAIAKYPDFHDISCGEVRIEKHWGHYDLTSPNRHTAPRKDEVVKWLKEGAARRNYKISDNIAKAIDTIIRCAEAKSGGNSY